MSHGFGDWTGHVRVHFIPHSEQRYPTCGDWQMQYTCNGRDLVVRISDTGSPDQNFTLFMHELNEALLYLYKRHFDQSAQEAVDKFDKEFDDATGAEPGCDPLAPYYAEHMFATVIEHNVAAQLRLDWNEYTENLAALDDDVTETEAFEIKKMPNIRVKVSYPDSSYPAEQIRTGVECSPTGTCPRHGVDHTND